MIYTKSKYITDRFLFYDSKYLATEIRNSMLFRYLLASIALVFLYFSRHSLPYPYPHLFYFILIFLTFNVLLHLLSLNKKWHRVIISFLPYADIATAPVIFQFTGGFLSPFIISCILTAIHSSILLTNNRQNAKYIILFLFVSYLSIALLQKYGILDNPVDYTDRLMHNNFFFYFITILISVVIVFGLALAELLKLNLQKTVDDLIRSFDTILKGTTAVVSNDLYNNLLKYCSDTFNIRCMFIGEFNREHSEFSTLVIWHNGKSEKNYSLPLKNSLANEILKRPDSPMLDVSCCSRYRDDPILSFFPVAFLYGIPLKDSTGLPIGILCALNDTPVKALHLFDPLISIFASRAAAEMERNIIDAKRIQIEQQLATARKMEAIGHMAGGIAHDFNNVIGAISGYATLLQRKLGEDHKHARYINHILNAGKQASVMINQLSLFVKDSEPQIEPVDVNTAITETISHLKQLVTKDIAIVTNLNADISFSAGDRSLLQNALLNLGLNAGDAYNSTAGTIVFSTSTTIFEQNSVLCQSFQLPPGKCICIRVEDNGIGMTQEVLQHIFEPFYSTKPKGKGTGLGLANVWRYIESFQGAIEVTSEMNKGTTFSLYLPPFSSYLKTSDAPSVKISEKCKQKFIKSILIVDDEASVREIYSDVLSDNGYSVFTRCNGQEALEFIKTGEVAVDLVILDMVMPVMNGPDTFKAIRDLIPDIRILLMSGFSNKAVLTELLKKPCTSFFQKPCNNTQLIEHIHAMEN